MLAASVEGNPSTCCRGQQFAEASGKPMAQHVSSDKRKEKARSAWGTAESMDSIKALFSKAVSEGGVFPWAEAGLPKASRAARTAVASPDQRGHAANQRAASGAHCLRPGKHGCNCCLKFN